MKFLIGAKIRGNDFFDHGEFRPKSLSSKEVFVQSISGKEFFGQSFSAKVSSLSYDAL